MYDFGNSISNRTIDLQHNSIPDKQTSPQVADAIDIMWAVKRDNVRIPTPMAIISNTIQKSFLALGIDLGTNSAIRQNTDNSSVKQQSTGL